MNMLTLATTFSASSPILLTCAVILHNGQPELGHQYIEDSSFHPSNKTAKSDVYETNSVGILGELQAT